MQTKYVCSKCQNTLDKEETIKVISTTLTNYYCKGCYDLINVGF